MKKLLSVLLATILAFSLLAGCGTTGGGSSSVDASSTPAASSVTDSTGTASEPDTNNEDIVIKVYAGTAAFEEASKIIVNDYKAETGITVEWELHGDDSYTLLKTRFAANDAPDVFDLANGDYSSWGVRCEDLSNEPWIASTDATALAPATVDGKLLGFPYAVEGNGILYNKELFEQASIDKLPETLDELEAVCKKLQDAGIQPFGEAFKEWGFLMHIFGTVVAYEDDPEGFCAELNAGTKTLADLKYIDNFFRLYDMTLNYGLGAESVGYGVRDQIADFAQGKMAMIKQGTWYGDPLWGVNPDIKVGLLAVPLTNNAADTKLMTSATRYMSVANTSENKQAAKDFLIWLQKNAQKYFVDSNLRLASPYEGMDLSNLGSLNEDMQNYMNEGKAFAIFGNEYFPSGFVTDIATPLQAYAAGVIDKAGAITELQAAYENRLATTG